MFRSSLVLIALLGWVYGFEKEILLQVVKEQQRFADVLRNGWNSSEFSKENATIRHQKPHTDLVSNMSHLFHLVDRDLRRDLEKEKIIEDLQWEQLSVEAYYMDLLEAIKKAAEENRKTCGKHKVFHVKGTSDGAAEFVSQVQSCEDIRSLPSDCDLVEPRSSGIHRLLLQPSGEVLEVLCDNESLGGGWTVVLNRFDGNLVFHNRTWIEFVRGFGSPCGEFFIGLEALHRLTSAGMGNELRMKHELRMELTDFYDVTASASYDDVHLSGADEGFRWSSLGSYSGDAGDSLGLVEGIAFSTSEDHKSECARKLESAGWFRSCNETNLFGRYVKKPGVEDPKAMRWRGFRRTHLKKLRILLRRKVVRSAGK